MRISAGFNKGRSLKVSTKGTRPTRGMVRQAIFNILGDTIFNARVLDMFAGSGALGIEAISRGAHLCVFVEKNPGALRANIKACNLSQEKVTLLVLDFRFGLRKLAGTEFDVIFIDPPYERGYLALAFNLVKKYGLLHQEGIIVAEHSAYEEFHPPSGLMTVREKKYGDTMIRFLTKECK